MWVLYLGRIIQAIAGSATWIAAFAMLVDNTRPERMGFWMTMAMSLVTGAFIAGPAVSGAVFQVAGYWAAWAIPFGLFSLDFISRLLMIDRKGDMYSTKPTQDPQEVREAEESRPIFPNSDDHYDSLGGVSVIARQSDEDRYSEESSYAKDVDVRGASSPGFYKTLLRSPGLLVGISNILVKALIVAGFDATLPLYLINEFHWNTLHVGLIFLAIQGPNLLFGPMIGIIQDRIGLRIPTVLGWLLTALFLWLLGCPAEPTFHWAQPRSKGEVIVITSIVGIGFAMLCNMGAGAFQLVGTAIQLPANLLRTIANGGFQPSQQSLRLIDREFLVFTAQAQDFRP